MSIETNQVKLRLTTNKEIIKTLRKNKAIKTDSNGDYFPVQYDGQVFDFRPGIVITVGESVGEAIHRSSGLIVGDHLTGPLAAAVEIVGSFKLGDREPDPEKAITICPVCNKDFYSLTRLAKHYQNPLGHKKERPDLYDHAKAEGGGIDWETPLQADGDANADTDASDEVVKIDSDIDTVEV